jgi:hypothetical protein
MLFAATTPAVKQGELLAEQILFKIKMPFPPL